ncbi:hypothetical protein FDP41_009870 [Naegleria fowleri]|uniref:Uncharacterized protein n=1 Tax=Naegleria fowleri TaxID=5763 RepID=A0A6A5AYB1_NAEFO|nr:uncharacterized protein FDP41_009870 [Naegleria fowleri]KAF0971647.1 hypothetical protein FDP41_009870 [Naegleria fowleri]
MTQQEFEDLFNEDILSEFQSCLENVDTQGLDEKTNPNHPNNHTIEPINLQLHMCFEMQQQQVDEYNDEYKQFTHQQPQETSSIHDEYKQFTHQQPQQPHSEDLNSQKDTLTNVSIHTQQHVTDYQVGGGGEMQCRIQSSDAQNLTHSILNACDAKLLKIVESLIMYLHEQRGHIQLLNDSSHHGAYLPTTETTTTETPTEPSSSTTTTMVKMSKHEHSSMLNVKSTRHYMPHQHSDGTNNNSHAFHLMQPMMPPVDMLVHGCGNTIMRSQDPTTGEKSKWMSSVQSDIVVPFENGTPNLCQRSSAEDWLGNISTHKHSPPTCNTTHFSSPNNNNKRKKKKNENSHFLNGLNSLSIKHHH